MPEPESESVPESESEPERRRFNPLVNESDMLKVLVAVVVLMAIVVALVSGARAIF